MQEVALVAQAREREGPSDSSGGRSSQQSQSMSCTHAATSSDEILLMGELGGCTRLLLHQVFPLLGAGLVMMGGAGCVSWRARSAAMAISMIEMPLEDAVPEVIVCWGEG